MKCLIGVVGACGPIFAPGDVFPGGLDALPPAGTPLWPGTLGPATAEPG